MSTSIVMSESRKPPILYSPLPRLVWYGIALPAFGMFFAIFWSLAFNFDSTTATHCRVSNYLPSISAAFNYFPASSVWRICIALHCLIRAVIFFVYSQLNRRLKMDQYNMFARHQGSVSRFISCMDAIENISLLCLTMVTSGENKFFHVISFSLFVVSSISNLVATYFLHSSMVITTQLERKSLWMKKRFCQTNLASLFLVVYLYHRHNAYCEPGVYTFFALFEYIFVLSNIGFHYTAAYDFDAFLCQVVEKTTTKYT